MARWLTWSEAVAITGNLGFPSKMPGTSYGIPARACKVGSKLRAIAGTTCASCYAFKGHYGHGSVEQAQAKRLASLSDHRWSYAMASALMHAHGLIGKRKVHAKIKHGGRGWHRWHDAGDVQSLERICARS